MSGSRPYVGATLWSRLVVAAALTALTACGFQLRGTHAAHPSLSPMLVETMRPGSPLLPPLRRALANAGITGAEPGVSPAAVLRIVDERFDERVIALSAQGRPREVELTYRVEFEVLVGGLERVPRREVRLLREFAVSERDVLGKSHEADVLREALLHDMVSAIVRYVTVASAE